MSTNTATSPEPGPAPWWILIERDAALPGGALGEPLPPLILGPFTKDQALAELDSDSGTVYCLCTDDAKTGGYIVDDVRAFPRYATPEGERTALHEFISLGG